MGDSNCVSAAGRPRSLPVLYSTNFRTSIVTTKLSFNNLTTVYYSSLALDLVSFEASFVLSQGNLCPISVNE